MKRINVLVVGLTLLVSSPVGTAQESSADSRPVNQVLEWNQIFIDTLIATNTPNSSSQRLGAIVHSAIFDAYNGIERRYTPVFVHNEAPRGASRRGAVIAAAYTALLGLFPSRQPELDVSYAASWWRSVRAAASRASAARLGIEVAQPCLHGARPMDSARATLRSPVGPRSASGARRRRRSDR